MKFIDLVLYVVYAGTYSIVIPVLIGAFVLKKMNKRISIFYYGLVAVLVLDLIILFVDPRLRNAFLYLFTIIDLAFMTIVFTQQLRNLNVQRSIRLLAVLMILAVILDGLLYSGWEVNGWSNSIARMFIASMGIFYLSQMMTYDIERDLKKEPMLWVCVGAMIFNLIGFIDVFAGPIMSYSQNLYLQYYMLWAVCTLAMYLLYAKAFKTLYKNHQTNLL